MKPKMDKCSKCNGKGYLLTQKRVLYRCPKCLGRGELDWVENVVGANREREVPSINILVERYYQTHTRILYDYRETERYKH